MKVARLALLAWCFGSLAGGCESDLKLSLDGLSCSSDYRCAEGYACDRDKKLCVRNVLGDGGLLPRAGSAGVGGDRGWAGSGHSGAGGNAGAAGTSELGGQGGLDDAGAAGSDDLDAGPLDVIDGGPDGCVPVTLFRDRDEDSYGDVTSTGQGCPQPGWVTRAGDCRDDIAIVNPGQVGFFAEGFVDQNKPGNVSFDYDCSGSEDADPTNTPSTGEPNCSELLDPVSCMGTGFLPVAGRVGAGVNPLCGSLVRRDCVVQQLLNCTASDTDLTVQDAFRCR